MQANTSTLKNTRLQNWFKRGSSKQLCGHSIFTLDHGRTEQDVILFIHGFPTASWDWHAIWPAFEKDYRLVSLDMLGFGFSDKPNRRDYTIHKQADLFEALIDELALSEFHVVAHDYGVSVAQELIARQIEGSGRGQWLSCSLLNGGLFPETHRATRMQKILLGPFGALANRLLGYGQFCRSFSGVFGEQSKPSKQELDEFWELINYNDGGHLFSNLITYINDRIEHRERWVHALQESPIPLALINGSVDPVSGAHLVTRYKALDCRLDHLTELREIGHYPQVEDPQSVSASIAEFIGSL